jgi:hypothetical protein
LALLTTTSIAQPQGGRGGGGRGFFPPSNARLLAIDEVRTEIGVKDDQKAKIDPLLADARERMQSGFNFEGFRDLSESEREKRMTEFRQRAEEVNNEVDAKLATILDSKQMERLAQLRLQQEGPSAIARAEVAEELNLTKEQRDKVAKIQEDSRGGGGGDFAAMRERREKANADILAVLTEEQKTKWNEMKGKEFTFPDRGGRGQGGGNRQRD